MGTSFSGLFPGTQGGKSLYHGNSKSDALSSVNHLPQPIQRSTKSFFKRGSNRYDNFSVTRNKDGTYTMQRQFGTQQKERLDKMKDSRTAFKRFSIGKAELTSDLGGDLNTTQLHPVIVTARDVIGAIEKYTSGTITQEQLLDWVNTLWFTDLFYYDPKHEDSIASVMSILEELDEDGVSYPKAAFDTMIQFLKENREVDYTDLKTG